MGKIRRHLSLEGELFDPKEWSEAPPGEALYHYSNAGFTLLGYLVEQVAGEPFQEFTRRRIFAPLGMDTATWQMAAVPDQDLRDVANTYRSARPTRRASLIGPRAYPFPTFAHP